MHIAATLDTSGTRLKTQLKRCWATPSSSPTDETEYSFIDNFCGTDDELNVYETLTVHANGDTAQSSFSLDSFTFTEDSGSIFLHCEVNLIWLNSHNSIYSRSTSVTLTPRLVRQHAVVVDADDVQTRRTALSRQWKFMSTVIRGISPRPTIKWSLTTLSAVYQNIVPVDTGKCVIVC